MRRLIELLLAGCAGLFAAVALTGPAHGDLLASPYPAELPRRSRYEAYAANRSPGARCGLRSSRWPCSALDRRGVTCSDAALPLPITAPRLRRCRRHRRFLLRRCRLPPPPPPPPPAPLPPPPPLPPASAGSPAPPPRRPSVFHGLSAASPRSGGPPGAPAPKQRGARHWPAASCHADPLLFARPGGPARHGHPLPVGAPAGSSWSCVPPPARVSPGRRRVSGYARLNRVRFNGRVNGQPLAPGKYMIDVVVVRGKHRTASVGRCRGR